MLENGSETFNKIRPAFRYEIVDWSTDTGYDGSTAVVIYGDPYRSVSPVFASVERAKAYIETDSKRYVTWRGGIYSSEYLDEASDLNLEDLVVRKSGNKRLLYIVEKAEELERGEIKITGWRCYYWGIGRYTTFRAPRGYLTKYTELPHREAYELERTTPHESDHRKSMLSHVKVRRT